MPQVNEFSWFFVMFKFLILFIVSLCLLNSLMHFSSSISSLEKKFDFNLMI